jgi:serine/threonine protein kinase
MTQCSHDNFTFTEGLPEMVALDNLVQKCLAKDRNDRFSSVAEMRRLIIPRSEQFPAETGYPVKQGDLDTSETRRFTD